MPTSPTYSYSSYARSKDASSVTSTSRPLSTRSSITPSGHFDRHDSVSRLAKQASKALLSRRNQANFAKRKLKSNTVTYLSKYPTSSSEEESSHDKYTTEDEGRESEEYESSKDSNIEVEEHRQGVEDVFFTGELTSIQRLEQNNSASPFANNESVKSPESKSEDRYPYEREYPFIPSCPPTPIITNKSSSSSKKPPLIDARKISKQLSNEISKEMEQDSNVDDKDVDDNGMSRFEVKLHLPGRKIKDLLIVIDSMPSGPRRMNACGALKTLSAIPANRIRLAWTRGVIPTLSKVLVDSNASVVEMQRAVSTLLNLCMPKGNHGIVFSSPGFVKGISHGLTSSCLKTKQNASQCVDILAKHDDNKFQMFDKNLLINAICTVILNKPNCEIESNSSGYSSLDLKTSTTNGIHSLALSARLLCLLTLRHLSRVKDIAYKFSNNKQVMDILLAVSGTMEPSSNSVCIAIFADITRHPQNSLQLVYHINGFLSALVNAVKSNDSKCRQYACYAIQNLSCNMGCRQELATTRDLLSTLGLCALKNEHPDEQIASVGAIKNISNDPSNFVNLSNTSNNFEVLTMLATSTKNEKLRYLVCDTLSTLANWIAASAIAGMNVNNEVDVTHDMLKPTLNVETWNQWL